jgi:carotenoid 1,2-hydratase
MCANDIRRARTLWPDRPSAPDAGDDADGVQHAVSGDGGRIVRPQLARMDGFVPATGRADENSGGVPGGGQRASGAGRADGGLVGSRGGGVPARGPDFARAVPHDGYAWWYVDALSDDGQNGITIIAFIGSVFSPYYKFARRHGPADPLNHCTLNVAVYRPGGKRWAMTERPRGAVARSTDHLQIGPSRLDWDGKTLTIHINEVTVPFPGRLRGTVRVVPTALTTQPFELNEDGRHMWWPIAPRARVQVALDEPHLRWQGDGYLDMNSGDAPVENGFTDWQWARGALHDGAAIVYEAQRCDGTAFNLAMRFDDNGGMHPFTPPEHVPLRRTGWRVDRRLRSETDARVIRTLEDAPFYARSVVAAQLCGEPVMMMHESLSLNRFRMPLVQAMLPFRMPRAWK